MADRWVLVTRDDEADTLHRNPTEQCNTDDAAKKQTIDDVTALRLKLGGLVRPCKHCIEPTT